MPHKDLAPLAAPLLLMLAVASPAAAQTTPGDGRALASFEAGSLDDQLALDITPVPAGMGALFVPSLTSPRVEPRVIVFNQGKRVASGAPGKRIVLPPGTYEVRFGRGDQALRAVASVTVEEGKTAPVQYFYGGVRVEVVDRDGRPFEQEYTLRSLKSGKVYPVGKSSLKADYEASPTWVLPPGPYALEVGDGEDAEAGQFVFLLHAGELLRYRLVVSDGRLQRVTFAERQLVVKPERFKLRWVVGGDLGLESTRQQISTFNGDALRLGVFTKASLGLDLGNHLVQTDIDIDESWLALSSRYGRGLPLQKLSDELRLGLLYTYQLGGIIGPYVRVSGRTALFDTMYFPDTDVTLITTDTSGQDDTTIASAGDEVRLLGGFNPLVLQGGGGVGITALDNKYVSLRFRGGVAAWRAAYDNGRLITSQNGSTVRLARLSDKLEWGPEAVATLNLSFGETFGYSTTFDAFLPSGQLGDDDFSPVFRWNHTVTLSLGRFAALVYDATLHRDDPQLDSNQLRHNLSVRLQHTLF